MPAPPAEIRIKRKATDDPIDLLRVQNEVGGSREIKPYYFKRQRRALDHGLGGTPPPSTQARQPTILLTGEPQVPRVESLQKNNLRSLDDHDSESIQDLPYNVIESSDGQKLPSSDGPILGQRDQRGGVGSSQKLPDVRKNEIRRFHLSKTSIQNPPDMTSSQPRGESGAHAVFVERRQHTDPAIAPIMAKHPASTPGFFPRENVNLAVQQPSTAHRTETLLRNVELPSGSVDPWDVNSPTLAEDMQAYSSRELGPQLAEASKSDPKSSSSSMIKARQVSRFKPKAPTLRYRDRYPTQDPSLEERETSVQDEVMADAGETESEESDFVMDIYIRLPAEMFEYQEQKNVGLLVLDSQLDIDEFYNDESDSDSEVFDEEEDENAENHPSTDYPEDEVDSDDEYDRNPYRYRNRNASDNEDFDEDDATYSSDEAKPPWARRPWMSIHSCYDTVDDDDDED